jgi:hypothetical protein
MRLINAKDWLQRLYDTLNALLLPLVVLFQHLYTHQTVLKMVKHGLGR